MTSSRQLLRHARRLYDNPLAPASTNRHNRHQWVRSVRQLGDKWLLAKPLERQA